MRIVAAKRFDPLSGRHQPGGRLTEGWHYPGDYRFKRGERDPPIRFENRRAELVQE